MALILKIYLFRFFSQFFNGMAAFVQVSLVTIFYAVSVIFLSRILLGFNYLPLVNLNCIVFIIEDIFNMAYYIMCNLFYHIYFTLNWIIFFYFCDKSRVLFNSSPFLFCFSISWCTYKRFILYQTTLYLGIAYSNFIKIIPFIWFIGAYLSSGIYSIPSILFYLVSHYFQINTNFLLSMLFGIPVVNLFLLVHWLYFCLL